VTFDDFVGLPYVSRGRGPAYDCWGLVTLVYREMAATDLPSFAEAYTTAEDRDEVATLIAGHLAPWIEIPPGDERVLDCVLMSEGRALRHIGVVVKPGFLLHVASGHESRIERYHDSTFKRRVKGFFRYRAFADQAVA